MAAQRPRFMSLAARGESLASPRDGRGAPPARRDDREYREYLSEEQRSRRGCIARRMQPDFHHGLLKGCATFLTIAQKYSGGVVRLARVRTDRSRTGKESVKQSEQKRRASPVARPRCLAQCSPKMSAPGLLRLRPIHEPDGRYDRLRARKAGTRGPQLERLIPKSHVADVLILVLVNRRIRIDKPELA